MTRIRRSGYLLFHASEGRFLDLELLEHGVAAIAPTRELHAIAVLTGEAVPISSEELDLVLSVPSDRWVEVDGREAETVDRLVRHGVLLSDAADAELAALRGRDERLDSAGWNLYAAVYHFMTRWRDIDLSGGTGEPPHITREAIALFVEERGEPPGAFHGVSEPRSVTELPLVRGEGGLYDALAARRTTRGFDRDRELTLDELALVLYEVFGCHGTAPIHGDIFAVKRTSPSGGGLHPVEAYPLVTGVSGVAPGLYHYRAADHALELLEPIAAADGMALTTRLVAGQTYFGSAHVSVLLTARFPRNHWKYRRHQKAYTAILMDAAHLSQTLYLVAAELGLGAYLTAAINSVQVDELLGIDAVEEGAIAICGFGPRPPGRQPLEPRFTPYVPRETVL